MPNERNEQAAQNESVLPESPDMPLLDRIREFHHRKALGIFLALQPPPFLDMTDEYAFDWEALLSQVSDGLKDRGARRLLLSARSIIEHTRGLIQGLSLEFTDRTIAMLNDAIDNPKT